MTYIIPNQSKKIIQTNESDISGNLYVTKNIDLRNNGYIKLSHLPIAIMTEDNDADFTSCDTLFKGYSGYIYANSSHEFRSSDDSLNAFVDITGTDTNSPTPGEEEDGLFFNGSDIVTDGNDIYYNQGTSTWTKLDLGLQGPTQMAVLDTFNVLLVGSSNLVKMIDISWTLTKTLTLPADYEVTAIDTNGSTAYIGTRHKYGGEGRLFTWDGSSSAWNSSYGVDATEISAIRKYGASCVLFTSKGQLLQFNGSSFTTLANFPAFYDKDTVDLSNAQNNHDNVSNRGLYVDKDNIYIKIYSVGETDFNSTFPSGVWLYNQNTGLSCLNTASYNRITTKIISTDNVDISTNIITTTDVPITGTQVSCYSDVGTFIGGLDERTIYYVIKLSDTTLKLATSYSNALAGIAIDLTGTGNIAQMLKFFPVYDYGQTFTGNRGAVLILNSDYNPFSYKTDNLIYSSQLRYPDKVVINRTSPLLNNRGYFITPKLNSSNLEDIYNEISIKHRPLKDNESIIVKYRTTEKLGLPFGSFDKALALAGTWTDTNTFTTTLDMTKAEVGDEIEIVAGKGAGMLFHIESLVNNSGTWTVNLDETFDYAVNAETMYFYVNNFKKLAEITSTETAGLEYFDVSLDKNSKFVQLKVELRGLDVTIEELQVKNTKFKS